MAMQNMKEFTQKLIRRAENGFGVAVQTIWYSILLFGMMGFVYDMGNVVYVQQVAQNSVIIAADELTKDIDRERFIRYQEVSLRNVNVASAQAVVDGLTSRNLGNTGRVVVTSAQLDSTTYYPKSVVVVAATATAHLPVLSALTQMPYNGPMSVSIVVNASAEPAFGIDGEVSDTDQ
jgi:hypothetical protein